MKKQNKFLSLLVVVTTMMLLAAIGVLGDLGSCKIKDISFNDISGWDGSCLDSHKVRLFFADHSCDDFFNRNMQISGVCNYYSHGSYDCKTCNDPDCKAGFGLTGSRITLVSSAECGQTSYAECEYNSDCESGFNCNNGQCIKITCGSDEQLNSIGHGCVPKTVLTVGKLGDACNPLASENCDNGLHCVSFNSISGVCMSGDHNEICADDDDCDALLSCKYKEGYIDEQGFKQDVRLRCVYPLEGDANAGDITKQNQKLQCDAQGGSWNDATGCSYAERDCVLQHGDWDDKLKICIFQTPAPTSGLGSGSSGDVQKTQYENCLNQCDDIYPTRAIGILQRIYYAYDDREYKNTECKKQCADAYGSALDNIKQDISGFVTGVKSKAGGYFWTIVLIVIALLIFAPTVLFLGVGVIKSIYKKLMTGF